MSLDPNKLGVVRGRIENILVGMNVIDTLVILLSLASSTAAMIVKMPRADFLEMCGHYYDRRTAELATRKIIQ